MSELSPEAKFIKMLGEALRDFNSNSNRSMLLTDEIYRCYAFELKKIVIEDNIAGTSSKNSIVITGEDISKFKKFPPTLTSLFSLAVQFSKSDETSILLHKLST